MDCELVSIQKQGQGHLKDISLLLFMNLNQLAHASFCRSSKTTLGRVKEFYTYTPSMVPKFPFSMHRFAYANSHV